MDLIFKVTGTPGKYEKVGDTNFKDHYGSIHKHTAWSTLKPFIRQATKERVIPYIGQSLYDDIASKFQNDVALTTEQTEFLELLQDTVAFYTVYHALPHNNIVISDMGAQENSASEGTSMPARQWSFKATLWSCIKQADANLDAMLAYLEKQVEAPVAYFDLWKDDDSYHAATSAYFRHTSELNKYLNIHGSRRTYMALLPSLRKAEIRFIKEILCQDMYTEINDQVKSNSLTVENKALLDKIQPAVAEWGLYLAVPHLAVVIENDGFKVVSSTDGMDTKGNVLNAFGKDAPEGLRARAEEDAKVFTAELIGFLYDNADDYPTWKNSPCYQDPDEVSESVTCPEDLVGGIWI